MIGPRASLALAAGLAILLAAASPAGAQIPTVRWGITPDSGITDTTPVQLVIEIVGLQQPNVAPPRFGKLTNLSVIGGPNTSSSFSWVNGRSSTSYKISYTLLPRGAGEAVIPSMSLQVDSRPYPLEEIRFQVTAAGPGVTPRRATPGSSREQADVLLRAQLGAEEVWVGQPVPLTVSLWSAQRVSDVRWRTQPDFAAFWVETVDVDPERESYPRQVSGRNYRVYPLDRRMLVPVTAGELTIEPYVVQLQVAARNADWFDIFGRSQTVIRKSQPLPLRVRPLPPGAPDGFSGAVGSYSLEVTLDRAKASVNEAVALRATVEGEGSLRNVEAPRFAPPPELKVYDPEVTSTSQLRGGKMLSRKTWEWIVVPLAPGEVTLPELSFSYFDPAGGDYRTTSSGALRLAVERGDDAGGAPVARGGGIRLERRDLAFIKPLRGTLAEARPPLHERGLFLLLLFLPLAWMPLIILVGRHRDRLARDRGLARARRARSRARKRLQVARRQLRDADAAAFHAAVGRALVEYVADRFNRAPAGLTYDLADELWAAKGVDEPLRRRFRSCLEACDFARFVPASASAERRGELLDEAMAVVDQLERA